MTVTVRALAEKDRDFCTTVVVESNHDQALPRWLKDVNVAKDHLNARYWHELNAVVYQSIDFQDPVNIFVNPADH